MELRFPAMETIIADVFASRSNEQSPPSAPYRTHSSPPLYSRGASCGWVGRGGTGFLQQILRRLFVVIRTLIHLPRSDARIASSLRGPPATPTTRLADLRACSSMPITRLCRGVETRCPSASKNRRHISPTARWHVTDVSRSRKICCRYWPAISTAAAIQCPPGRCRSLETDPTPAPRTRPFRAPF